MELQNIDLTSPFVVGKMYNFYYQATNTGFVKVVKTFTPCWVLVRGDWGSALINLNNVRQAKLIA